MRERQVNYMIFERPIKSKVWTRTSDEKLSGLCYANLFGLKQRADVVAGRMIEEDGESYYTVFECREVGFTASVMSEGD